MKTKKIIGFLMVNTGLMLLPFAVGATTEDDSNISSVTISNISTTAPGAAADYTFSVVTSIALAAQTQIVISFFDATNTEIAPDETGFDFTNIIMTNANFDASALSWPDADNAMASVNLNHEIAAGSYFFTLAGIVNPSVDGTFQVGMTTDNPITSNSPYTKSAEFDIGAGGSTEDGDEGEESGLENAIATLTLDRVSSFIANQKANYTLTMEINRDMDITEVINVFIDTGEAGPDKAGFSFNNSTLDSDDFEADIVAEGNGVIAEIHPTTALTAGTYTFTLENIQNSSTPATYYVRATTSAVELGADMAFSRGFNIIGVPDKPTKLKTKKIKTTSATLSWKGGSVATSYKLQLSNKKGKKIKTFKNFTTTKKVIKSKTKLLNPAKTYKFRARACNEAGCSKWSKYKSFKTKASRQTLSSPITSLTFESETYEPSVTATQTWTIVVASTISSSDRIEIQIAQVNEQSPGTSYFDCTSGSTINTFMNSSTISATFACDQPNTNQGTLTLNSALAAGTHSFTLSGMTNPAAGTYTARLQLISGSGMEATDSEQFTIAEEADTNDEESTDAISAIEMSSVMTEDNFVAGETTNYVLNITTSSDLTAGDTILISFESNAIDLMGDPGFDVSGASLSTPLSSSDLSATLSLAGLSDEVIVLTLTSDFSGGTYLVLLNNIVNTSTVGSYYVGARTGDIADQSITWVFTDAFTITESTESDEEEVTVECNIPDKHSGIESELASVSAKVFGTNVGLNWKDFTDVTNYTVMWSTQSDFSANEEKSKGIGDSEYVVAGLQSNTKYYFAIFAYDDDCSALAKKEKNSITKKPITTTKFSAPSVPKKKISKTSALVKWDTNSYITSYTIKLLNSKGKKIKTFKNITINKKRLTNLKPNTTYQIQLQAIYVTEEATKFSEMVPVITKKKMNKNSK